MTAIHTLCHQENRIGSSGYSLCDSGDRGFQVFGENSRSNSPYYIDSRNPLPRLSLKSIYRYISTGSGVTDGRRWLHIAYTGPARRDPITPDVTTSLESRKYLSNHLFPVCALCARRNIRSRPTSTSRNSEHHVTTDHRDSALHRSTKGGRR